MTKPDHTLGIRIWLIILTACGLAAIPFRIAGFHLASLAFLETPIVGACCGRLLMRYRETYRLGAFVDGLFQMTFVSLVGVMTCYAAATIDAPLIDAELLRFDRAIGYDWLAFARFVAGRPMLNWSLMVSYKSCFVQPALLAAALLLSGRQARYEMFILSMLLGLAFTALIFAAFPATTAWTYLGQEAMATSTLVELPVSNRTWIANLLEVRAGGGRLISEPLGIIAFPSFHCVMALLNVRAVWPVRSIRYPFMLLNGLMIASAPLIGGHYVTDLIAGAVVALAAAASGEKAHDWLCRSQLDFLNTLDPEPIALRPKYEAVLVESSANGNDWRTAVQRLS